MSSASSTSVAPISIPGFGDEFEMLLGSSATELFSSVFKYEAEAVEEAAAFFARMKQVTEEIDEMMREETKKGAVEFLRGVSRKLCSGVFPHEWDFARIDVMEKKDEKRIVVIFNIFQVSILKRVQTGTSSVVEQFLLSSALECCRHSPIHGAAEFYKKILDVAIWKKSKGQWKLKWVSGPEYDVKQKDTEQEQRMANNFVPSPTERALLVRIQEEEDGWNRTRRITKKKRREPMPQMEGSTKIVPLERMVKDLHDPRKDPKLTRSRSIYQFLHAAEQGVAGTISVVARKRRKPMEIAKQIKARFLLNRPEQQRPAFASPSSRSTSPVFRPSSPMSEEISSPPRAVKRREPGPSRFGKPKEKKSRYPSTSLSMDFGVDYSQCTDDQERPSSTGTATTSTSVDEELRDEVSRVVEAPEPEGEDEYDEEFKAPSTAPPSAPEASGAETAPSPAGIEEETAPAPAGIEEEIPPAQAEIEQAAPPAPAGIEQAAPPAPAGIEQAAPPALAGIEEAAPPASAGIEQEDEENYKVGPDESFIRRKLSFHIYSNEPLPCDKTDDIIRQLTGAVE